ALTVVFRFVMSAIAALWTIVILTIGAPRAVVALRNFEAHRHDQLRERPNADFAVGVKILPDLKGLPLPTAIHSDSALADTLDVDAVAVVITPGATRQAIDSLSKVLAPARLDSTLIVAVIGYRGTIIPELRRAPFDQAARLATVRQVIDRIHPDILLPAEDPYGSGERVLGALPVERWESYLTE